MAYRVIFHKCNALSYLIYAHIAILIALDFTYPCLFRRLLIHREFTNSKRSKHDDLEDRGGGGDDDDDEGEQSTSDRHKMDIKKNEFKTAYSMLDKSHHVKRFLSTLKLSNPYIVLYGVIVKYCPMKCLLKCLVKYFCVFIIVVLLLIH